jgi:hypothetical protein
VIEPRVYRAAFLPAIIAFALAMFSLEPEPPAADIDLAADVLFEGDSAADVAERIVRRYPDRAPGSAGNLAVADLVARSLEERGFDVEADDFSARGRALRNVVGTRIGVERERIVVAAARDSAAQPDLAGSAADTAALLGIATALEGRAPQRTIVLASLDGSTLGDAGARRFAETTADSELVEAVLVVSDAGAATSAGPRLVAWSNDDTRGSIGLERTAGDALLREFEDVPGDAGVPTQFSHLALPIGIGTQGVLLDSGLESIRFSGSGLLPVDPEVEEIDADRIGGVGRAALQTVSAIDASDGLEHGPPAYLTFARSVLPAWAVSILSLTLILPALVASVDAFARARRQNEPVASWISWVVARIVPFAVGLLVGILLVVAGLAPNVSRAAPAPSVEPLDASAAALLGVVAAAIALAWIFARPVLARWGGAPGDSSAPGAGCAAALFVSAAAVAAWFLNPWAALALAPAANLWALASLAPGQGRSRRRTLLVAGGLLVPVGIVLLYMLQLGLDPLEALWYGFLLVTGGQVDLLSAIVGCVLLGCLIAVVEVLVARRHGEEEPAREPTPPVRGPGGYAGPGSLGGTESALRR